MKRIALICMLVFLVGCSTVVDVATKTADVWMDPSVPVGEPEDRPSTLTLSMNASSQVNPNIYNDNALAEQVEVPQAPEERLQADPQEASEITPITFKIIKLKDDPLLLQADNDNALVVQEEVPQVTVEKLLASPQQASGVTTPIAFKIIKLKNQPLPLQTENNNASVVQEEIPQVPVEKLPASPQQAAEIAAPEETFKPEATPIAFKIIQLKDNSLFLQADFEGLSTDMEKTLGTTYLTHDDFMLVPNEFKFVEPFEVEEKTRYIAVAAAYNDYASKQWKGIVKIKPKGKEYSLLLHFNEQQVVIKKQEL